MSKLHAIVTLSFGVAACGDPSDEQLEAVEQALYDCNAPTQRMTCAPPPQPGKRFICHGTANRRVKIAVALDSAHEPGVAHGVHDLADAEPGASAADTGDTALDCDCEPRVCADVCTGAPDGVGCDDGDPCTIDGACSGGVCSTGPARCHEGDLVDACTRLTGACSDGTCATEPVACVDDGNACTADACDPIYGCIRPPVECVDDGNACTVESCDPAIGCVRTPLACDDGNACTADSCDPAVGCVQQEVSCDDGNACTADSCDPATGCARSPIACDDHDACTADACDAAVGCVFSTVNCDDGNACTTEACDSAIGCIRAPSTCDDGNACTTDGCDPATGCSTSPVECADDGNVCTTELCEPGTGCTQVTNTNPCDDGDASTLDDVCRDGVCAGTRPPPDGIVYPGGTVVDIVRDPGAVYFAVIGVGTLRMAHPSGAVTFLTPAPYNDGVTKLAVDDQYLYILERIPGTVTRYPKLGGAGVIVATELFGGEALDVDDAYIYASSGTNADSQSLWRIPKAGGARVLLDSGLRSIWDLGVDASSVYYTEHYTGSLHRIPKLGGARATLAQRSGVATHVEVGPDHAYFMTSWSSSHNAGPPSINRVAKTGGPYVELVVFPSNDDYHTTGLDLVGDWLYWNVRKHIGRVPTVGGATQSLVDRTQVVREVEVIGDTMYFGVDGSGLETLRICADQRILDVGASANAIRMEGSVANHIDLSAGTHVVTVTGNATTGGGGVHPWVIARYPRAGGDGFELLPLNATTTIELEEAGPLYGFVFDQWGSITFHDNGGAHTVATDAGSFTVHGVSNTFLLDTTVAARLALPAGAWRGEVTGDAAYAPGHAFGNVMVGAYPAFPSTNRSHAMFSMGATFDFTSLGFGGDGGANNFFAFFADYGDFSDNTGSARFRFCRQ